MSCTPTIAVDPTFIAITGAALVDSINPCAIAVLLILLTSLLSLGNRRAVLKTGLFFILGLFLVYYAIGLGLLGVVKLSGFAPILHRIVAAIALLIGLANLKDYFYYGGLGFVTEVPRRWRPKMKSLLTGVTSPIGAFLIGAAVTFFELPCTGGPYLFTLGLLSDGFSMISAATILICYNLIFVLPLLLLLGLVYFGYTTAERATNWKDKNIRLLHLIAGVIMIGLAIWLWLS